MGARTASLTHPKTVANASGSLKPWLTLPEHHTTKDHPILSFDNKRGKATSSPPSDSEYAAASTPVRELSTEEASSQG